MRKFIVLFLILPFIIIFCSCKEENPYIKHISDLQEDVYTGNVGDINVSAVYGFREYPFLNDGVVGDTVCRYVFKLDVIPDGVHRSIELENDGKIFTAEFETDRITSEYKAQIETYKHFEKSFNITLICGSEKMPVTLTSILPDDCLTYEQVLQILTTEQKSLIDVYTSDDVFNAELYMRVLVRNGTPYWYVGIASGSGKLKALLVDGISGKLIAMRDVF